MTSKGALHRSIRAVLVFAFLLGAGCTLRTKPLQQTANDNLAAGPDGRGVAKSFFVDANGKAKTFLCGWAPETEIGFAEYTTMHNVPIATHCNLQFEITATELLGKMINPSFPNDPNHWLTVVTIPIKKHYYYEPKKDEYGRDTNEMIENDQRSDWSARPYMKLDLAGMQVQRGEFNFLGFSLPTGQTIGSGSAILAIEDIEWDLEHNFLGFTAVSTNPFFEAMGIDQQARVRINFLKFDHNPNFKKTPYKSENSKYFNVIQVVGEKVEGAYDVLAAAHWDVSRQHEVRLTNFPAKYVPVAMDVLANWNKTLQDIGAVKPGFNVFVPSTAPSKHSFDLRYTNINWVPERRISMNLGGTIGISMTNVDVRNGEILWSGVNIYGGELEDYIKSTSKPISPAVDNNFTSFMFNLNAKNGGFTEPMTLGMPTQMQAFTNASSSANSPEAQADKWLQLVNQDRQQTLKKQTDQLQKNTSLTDAQKAQAFQQWTTSTKPLTKAQSAAIMASAQIISNLRAQATARFFSHHSYPELITNLLMKTPSKFEQTALAKRQSTHAPMNYDYVSEIRDRFYKSSVYDLDYRISDFGMGLGEALNKAQQEHRSFDDVIKTVFKEVIAHEFGHSLGLGHNFKSNIVPPKGSVPDKYYTALNDQANDKAGFTNFSSLMGYPDSASELATRYEQYVSGPQDQLVLRYLYNQTYATYREGDEEFTFVPVPASGEIPATNPANADYKTSYFPQCNDLDASFGTDPYCNRFNKGTTASQIADNYIHRLNDNTIKDLYSLVQSRSANPELAEMYLWGKTLNSVGRLRLFYDYMRSHYKDQIDKIRGDEAALLAFSRECQQPDSSKIENATLKSIFTDNPELKELCAVNARILDQFDRMVGARASDYVVKDMNDKIVPGAMETGDAGLDYSRVFGSWFEMSGTALKQSALYALTSPSPWVLEGGLFSVPDYDYQEYRFAYSSLYPYEYTKAISSAVDKNLQFASLGDADRSSIGNTVLSMAYWNQLADDNNDGGIFPPQFIDKIRRQTNFRISYVAILLNGQKKEGAPFFVDRFTGLVYDMQTGKGTNLTDVYLLPDGQVIARAENMFLLPITQLQVFDDKQAYVIAYKVEYYKAYDDPLFESGLTARLRDLHDKLTDACIKGENGAPGLSKYFVPKGFPGFYMPPDTAIDQEKQDLFKKSIKDNFDAYYANDKLGPRPRPETCRETMRGLGILISTAAIVNGFWLPEASDYLIK